MSLGRTPRATLVALVVAILVVPSSARSAPRQGEDQEGWICPPCGHADDNRVYPAPGACPICGMALITTREHRARVESQITAAILVFDGVQIIDFAAPYEVFGQARFRVVTVSPDGKPVTTAMGMRVTPDHGFADAPAAQVLLVPGGDVHAMQASDDALGWVRGMAEKADYVLSVCNGAFILAEAGLLDGRTATTFYGMLDQLEASYPEIDVVRDQRYTDNGKILTSAGLSSGIDAALHLVSRISGERRARTLALHLEYDWDQHATFARGALADRHLPSLELDLPEGVTLRELSSLGGRDAWEVRWVVEGSTDTGAIVAAFARVIARLDGWKAIGKPGAQGMGWRFSTANDGEWTARLQVAPDGEAGVLSARLERIR